MKIWQPEQRLGHAAVRKGAAGCQAVGQTGSTYSVSTPGRENEKPYRYMNCTGMVCGIFLALFYSEDMRKRIVCSSYLWDKPEESYMEEDHGKGQTLQITSKR